MSATGHIKHYSAADIQRYLSGSMSPEEMHALELAALDDPFLADAIEGIQQTLAQSPQAGIDNDLQDLHERLQQRINEDDRRQAAPVIAFRWWQAAAAAVILIIGGLIVFDNFNNSKKTAVEQVAAVQHQDVQQSAAVPPAAEQAAGKDLVAADSTPSPAATEAKQLAQIENNVASDKPSPAAGTAPHLPKLNKVKTEKAAALRETKQSEEIVAYQHQPAATRQQLNANNYRLPDTIASPVVARKNPVNLRNQHPVQYNNISNRPADIEQIVVTKAPRDTSATGYLSKPRELAMNRSRKELSEKQAKKNPEALLSGFVSGRVTDQDNNPLSNVTLRIDGKRDYYFTDNKGLFNIPTSDTIVNVAVGSAGYYTQNLRLSSTIDNNIALNQLGNKAPNPVLNNALLGRVPGVQADTHPADSSAFAAFRSGEARLKANTQTFDNLNALYDEKSIEAAEPEYGWVKYQQYLDQNKHLPANGTPGAGKVVVSFEVGKKGLLSGFKIEESLGQAYDEEAIRLIKAGPTWKLLKGRKAKATVVVTF